ncbi:probable pectinesterase/pectinesterase inhibitor 12 isoform X2 [Medicago truncatula]|uniref:Pectinesterase n=1 Tax=Medicago truncatula TaxID=3880 RepID=A0A072V7R2_MEDTR|nr:probable pectinesterase/pectinesterase inhibitor 12 isoform X2 [Medicago truncatula]KEH37681.1 pectinesterase/pectinesterase inhibitor [Medicago truncatula]
MASSSHKLFILLFTILFSLTLPLNTNTSITTSLNPNKLTSLKSLCKTTPYPKLCFNSLKLSISININPNIITYLLHSLQLAISETTKLSNLFHDVGTSNIVEKQRGSIQDCKELHQSTLTSLKRSLSGIRSSNKRNIADARIYLSAALTNKNTCLDGLDSASGTYKPILVDSIINTYKHVSNSLSMLSNHAPEPSNQKGHNKNLVSPKWLSKSDSTVITGNRSVVDGWTTFRSATLAVSGDGFLARDIAIENRAGPEKHQAVALRVNADLTAFYKCAIYGYQDTLYVHSFRQFYRECDIYGTIDFIFGNAAVVLQECDIVSRMPLPGQFTVITAQSRDNPDEDTGISIQNCSIIATDELYSNSSKVKSYLGRPWRVFSRTVLIESYIDDFIDQKGWTKWSNDQGLDTLFYGEYENYGPGSKIDNRVEWVGYHLMDYNDAYNFSVSEFIIGDQWLESTSVPYDDGI